MTEPAPDLTPAEALLLMDPRGVSGTRLLKITLVALLLQRALRIEVREVRRGAEVNWPTCANISAAVASWAAVEVSEE